MFMRFGLPRDYPPNAQDIKSCAPARPAALRRGPRGKKRMKSIGNVEIPQEAFLAILKVDN
ncbi:MAG: hypothetical protein IPQ13_06465 [Holophagaceae bacterium]|nr:hypothetical protein [Holophagaceae bacterium]